MKNFLLFVAVFFSLSFSVADAATETVKIYPTDDGVNILYDNEQQTDWNLARSYSGQLAQVTNTDAETITLRSDNHSGFYRIYRGSVAFNTAVIPENAIIHSATINLYKYPFSNNHADTDVVLTSHVREDENVLTQSDWYLSKYGVEFARGLLLDGQYTQYELNQLGISSIDVGGLSIFGAMTEFDFDDNNPNVSPAGAAMYSSDALGIDTDPFLEVTYIVPDTEQTIDELISELKLIVENEIPKKANRAFYRAQIRALKDLIEKENVRAALVHIKVIERQIKHDKKKGLVTSETASKMQEVIDSMKETLNI